MPRGTSPKSKANLSPARKRALEEGKHRLVPGGGQRAATAAAAAKRIANRLENEEVGDLFAEGQELHGLTKVLGIAGTTLAELLKQERKDKELNPALTARIGELRKLINDILALRAQVTSDAPLILLADELAKRVRTMRTDESSPSPPEREPEEPDAED